MRRKILLTLALAAGTVSAALAANTTTTFENFGLPPDAILNDAGPGGQFLIDGHAFNNSYNALYQVWSGWAISTGTDNATAGYGNLSSEFPGSGAGGSASYAVGFPFTESTADPFHPMGSVIDLLADTRPISIDIANTTYAYLSMRDGDDFIDPFGAGDFLVLDIRGYDAPGGTGSELGEIDFYLADFLNGNTFLLDAWQTLDLSPLGNAKSLRFGLRSSDNDETYGINTPAFFAADNFQVQTVPEPAGLNLLAAGLAGLLLVARRQSRRWHANDR